ncbi:hypothetical protein [Marinivivus vitaminiproducens]|uniref:hypothetical protein n=1 Tax=Marinivivus vitaminiproducens TaxID=3035935 RepID=UPI0027A21385|nr:hypothetical protein P4R82_25085 [Geminicoccaceae bacterium SCSIO 64248]
MAGRILILTVTALSTTLSVNLTTPAHANSAAAASLFAACADYYADEGQSDKAATMRQAQKDAMAEAGLGQVEPAPIRNTTPEVANNPAMAMIAKSSVATTCGSAEVTAHLYSGKDVKSGRSFSRTAGILRELAR